MSVNWGLTVPAAASVVVVAAADAASGRRPEGETGIINFQLLSQSMSS